MNNLQKFDFVHLLDKNLVYHAEIKNETCIITWLNDGEETTVQYPKCIAEEYIEKGYWILQKGGVSDGD